MTDNVLQTLQELIQDVIAPDVRELKVRMTALEKQFDAAEKQSETRFAQIEARFTQAERQNETRFTQAEKQSEVRFTQAQNQTEARFNALHDQQDANFKAIMAAIGESKAKTDLDTFKLFASLSERVAALEAALRQSNPAH